MLLGLLLWNMLGGQRVSVNSTTSPTVAQAGQPVSATANPVNYTEINLNGSQLATAGVKPNAKPANPTVPAQPCKAVVFDPNGSMDRFGVKLAVVGTHYVITQTDGGLASPNDILAAQAAKKDWVTVVLDPKGAYAINSKGMSIPVTMDKLGRILVSAAQILI